MIEVRRENDVARVHERSTGSLILVGVLFALLGGLTVLGPDRTVAVHWLGSGCLFTVGFVAVLLSRRRRLLCCVALASASEPRRLVVAWDGPSDGRLSVLLDRDGELTPLYGGRRVGELLTSAERLADMLAIPLRAGDGASSARFPVSTCLPASPALRRAELSLWIVSGLLSADIFVTILGHLSKGGPLSRVSAALAVLAPLGAALLALGVRSHRLQISPGRSAHGNPSLHVEHRLLGRLWRHVEFVPSETLVTRLHHPALDLGFLWLRSGAESMILTSTAKATAELMATLTGSKPADELPEPAIAPRGGQGIRT